MKPRLFATGVRRSRRTFPFLLTLAVLGVFALPGPTQAQVPEAEDRVEDAQEEDTCSCPAQARELRREWRETRMEGAREGQMGPRQRRMGPQEGRMGRPGQGQRIIMRDGQRIRDAERWPRLGSGPLRGVILPADGLRGGRGLRSSGLRLVDMSPELGRYFGTEVGVLVLASREGLGLALQPGDVLLAIHGRSVQDARHAWSILNSFRPGETVTIQLRRHGEEIEVEGELEG